jgi:hypothetical protein
MTEWERLPPHGTDKLSQCGAKHPEHGRCTMAAHPRHEMHMVAFWRKTDRGHECRTEQWTEQE